MWMFGHVHCALAFGVRIHCRDGSSYVAPRNQVHQEILQQIELDGEARHGSPLCVAFQADHRPGSSEHEGFFRAKMVFPEALIFETAQVEGLQSDLMADCWRRQDSDGDETFSRLRRGMEKALEANDRSRLCEVLLCCLAAGLKVLWDAKRRHQDPRKALNGFVLLANEVSSSLSVWHAEVKKYLRPAVRFCRKCLEDDMEGNLPDHWSELKDWMDAVLSPETFGPARCQRRRCQPPCEVEGCRRKASRMKLIADSYGPPGWRCDPHGGRLPCNVPECPHSSVGRVRWDDKFGLAGHRCYQHGARRCEVALCQRPASGGRCSLHRETMRTCNALGCKNRPLGLVAVSDALGAAGYRCGTHGGGCNVEGCTRSHWGFAVEDNYGPAGRRCYKHGGKICSLPGCQCKPVRHVRDPDHFGPPGIRCKKHCLKKSGPMQRRSKPSAATTVIPVHPAQCGRTDGKGWRCKRPVRSGSRHCTYHYTVHVAQQRLTRRSRNTAKRTDVSQS